MVSMPSHYMAFWLCPWFYCLYSVIFELFYACFPRGITLSSLASLKIEIPVIASSGFLIFQHFTGIVAKTSVEDCHRAAFKFIRSLTCSLTISIVSVFTVQNMFYQSLIQIDDMVAEELEKADWNPDTKIASPDLMALVMMVTFFIWFSILVAVWWDTLHLRDKLESSLKFQGPGMLNVKGEKDVELGLVEEEKMDWKN